MNPSGLVEPLRERLRTLPDHRLFAVIDAARDPELARAARVEFGLRAKMLFRGEVAPYAEDFAPWLVPIPRESPFLETWVSRLGDSLGILIQTPETPGALRHSLRELFVVQDESGQEYFFRFYDPRVLRPFLEICDDAQSEALFQLERTVFVESESGALLECTHSGEHGAKPEVTAFKV